MASSPFSCFSCGVIAILEVVSKLNCDYLWVSLWKLSEDIFLSVFLDRIHQKTFDPQKQRSLILPIIFTTIIILFKVDNVHS